MKTSLLVIMMLFVILLSGCKKDDTVTNTTIGPPTLVTDWVTITAGQYTYGPGDTLKTIAYDFQIMKYEVTNAQYMQYLQEALAAGEITISGSSVQGSIPGEGEREYYSLGSNTSAIKFGQIKYSGSAFQLTPDDSYTNHPVVFVTWFGAVAFAKHYNLRIPTEQEWEKAARGTTGFDYPWGESIAQGDANYTASGDTFSEGTTPVGYYNGITYGSFQTTNRPGPYGAYDMAGNAWEWTDSFFGGSIPTDRVLRGGTWNFPTNLLRSWARNNSNPTARFYDNGFRCARTN